MNNVQKILLINFGGIGDEILFLPTICALKKKYPNAEITLALEKRSSTITQLTKIINKTIFVNVKKNGKMWELFKLLIKGLFGRYDIVVSSGANKAIPILLFLMGIKKRYGYDSGFLAKKLLTKAINLNRNQYAASMYFDLICDLTDEKVSPPQIELEQVEKLPDSVLIHPGVSKMSIVKNIYKTPSASFWTELIEQLLKKEKKVYLCGGPDDDEIIKEIIAKLEQKELLNNPNFINYFGKTKSLKDLALMIKSADIMICSDSAPMHISVGVGTKTLALFGPTDEKKLLPQNDERFIAIKANCDCRPCLWDKAQESCKARHCLNFNLQDILDQV